MVDYNQRRTNRLLYFFLSRFMRSRTIKEKKGYCSLKSWNAKESSNDQGKIAFCEIGQGKYLISDNH